MSISTSSSDSLEFDRSMPLFGYEADTNSSLEDCEEESDQETMAPPIKSKKKRNSSFVLPKLVKSQLRKMSGVFSSFMTPEKRMVRRIAELSRDKCTYFGCLVQDYVSFLQENKECHVSSTDMLQTIRQFMTQVKNYLAQSSELDPPIESLIPEDQIGKSPLGLFFPPLFKQKLSGNLLEQCIPVAGLSAEVFSGVQNNNRLHALCPLEWHPNLLKQPHRRAESRACNCFGKLRMGTPEWFSSGGRVCLLRVQ